MDASLPLPSLSLSLPFSLSRSLTRRDRMCAVGVGHCSCVDGWHHSRHVWQRLQRYQGARCSGAWWLTAARCDTASPTTCVATVCCHFPSPHRLWCRGAASLTSSFKLLLPRVLLQLAAGVHFGVHFGAALLLQRSSGRKQRDFLKLLEDVSPLIQDASSALKPNGGI